MLKQSNTIKKKDLLVKATPLLCSKLQSNKEDTKGYAKDRSNIELLIAGYVTGIEYYGLVEELRTAIHKRVDLLDTSQIIKNPELLEDILKDGTMICG